MFIFIHVTNGDIYMKSEPSLTAGISLHVCAPVFHCLCFAESALLPRSRPRHTLPQLVTAWFCHTSQTLHPGWVSEEDDGGRTDLSHIHRSHFLYRCLVWWHDSEGLMDFWSNSGCLAIYDKRAEKDHFIVNCLSFTVSSTCWPSFLDWGRPKDCSFPLSLLQPYP